MSANRGDAAVGMMDSAYFVGRRELLEFFNDLLAMNLTKIEQTASGAVACQLTDYIFPGSIPMSRVNWEAKSDYEYVNNYKLLQAAFTKNRIQRHVDVNKLIRAKYQDNLEFCQWLKAFFEQSGVYRPEYDPIAVRSKGKGGKKWDSTSSKNGRGNATAGSSGARTTTSRPKPKTVTTTTTSTSRPLTERVRNNRTSPTNNNEIKTTNSKEDPQKTDTAPTPTTSASQESSSSPTAAAAAAAAAEAAVVADAALMKKNADLTTKVTELELAVVEIEKERDFYFEKLRNVEVMLQVHQEKVDVLKAEGQEASAPEFEALVEKVFKVLYATAEDAITVTDDGEIVTAIDAVDTTFESANVIDDDLEGF